MAKDQHMTDEPHRICVYRLSKPLVPRSPLRVRSTGRYDVVAGWSEPPVKKYFVELTWTVSGEGEVLAGERYVPLRPGSIHVYRPGDVHHLRALSDR